MKTPVVQQHPQRRAAVSFKVEWGRTQQMWKIVHQQNNNKQNTCSGLKTGHLRLAFWSWACWGFLKRGCSWCYWQHCSVDSPFVHASILLYECFETVRLRLFFADGFFLIHFISFFQKKKYFPLFCLDMETVNIAESILTFKLLSQSTLHSQICIFYLFYYRMSVVEYKWVWEKVWIQTARVPHVNENPGPVWVSIHFIPTQCEHLSVF